MVDQRKLDAFLGQMLGDLGGAYSVALVRIGEQLGLYKALHEHGPMSAQDLADRTRTAERYVREWAAHQAASNYLSYEAESGKFTLPPEQAMVFAEEDSTVNMLGAFDNIVAIIEGVPKVQEAFHTGGGVDWGDHSTCLFCSVAKFFRPGYKANIVQEWLPALEGVTDKLNKGGVVADVGCGYGISTALMAAAFPNARFIGYDFHDGSIAHANDLAKQEGLANLSFEVASAKNFPALDYDLVTMFDCLHDLGDPVGAAAHIRSTMADDGTLMVVEPMAADSLEDNLNPLGRIFFGASTMVCVPTSLAQEVGAALGAQAGETKLREVISSGGFSTVRRATETDFNMILEARR